MSTETSMKLWGNALNGKAFEPSLDIYLIDSEKPLGTVLICPGGAYAHRAPHEGINIAKRYNEMGFQAFVVHYSVAPERHPAPLNDVSRALRIIRHNAVKWKVNPSKIAVCGFSAGGHLTASLGVHYDKAQDIIADEISRENNRPDALILCYPVISSGAYANKGSFKNLLGEDASPEMLEMMSLEKQVSEKTPTSFLWHTANDPGVPVENSIMFAQELSKFKIPFELHIYENGRHGLGLAPDDSHIGTWFELSAQWLKRMDW